MAPCPYPLSFLLTDPGHPRATLHHAERTLPREWGWEESRGPRGGLVGGQCHLWTAVPRRSGHQLATVSQPTHAPAPARTSSHAHWRNPVSATFHLLPTENKYTPVLPYSSLYFPPFLLGEKPFHPKLNKHSSISFLSSFFFLATINNLSTPILTKKQGFSQF